MPTVPCQDVDNVLSRSLWLIKNTFQIMFWELKCLKLQATVSFVLTFVKNLINIELENKFWNKG